MAQFSVKIRHPAGSVLDEKQQLDHPEGGAPLLSVFGGKITTFRKLAESAMEKIEPFFPQMGKPWTAEAKLPGGDFPYEEVDRRIAALSAKFPFIAADNLRRLFRAYGTDVEEMLQGVTSAGDLGRSFGPLTEREIDWLKRREWVVSADDILWRRSKLGLHMSQAEQDALKDYMADGQAREQQESKVLA